MRREGGRGQGQGQLTGTKWSLSENGMRRKEEIEKRGDRTERGELTLRPDCYTARKMKAVTGKGVRVHKGTSFSSWSSLLLLTIDSMESICCSESYRQKRDTKL